MNDKSEENVKKLVKVRLLSIIAEPWVKRCPNVKTTRVNFPIDHGRAKTDKKRTRRGQRVCIIINEIWSSRAKNYLKDSEV